MNNELQSKKNLHSNLKYLINIIDNVIFNFFYIHRKNENIGSIKGLLKKGCKKIASENSVVKFFDKRIVINNLEEINIVEYVIINNFKDMNNHSLKGLSRKVCKLF